MSPTGCPLCDAAGGALVFQADRFRLVRADEAGFPAFYRLVWSAHVAEFTDLSREDRGLCMDAVAAVEEVMRARLAPTKMNVASLGNAVPHLHWHVIARFDWDSHFPGSVWAAAQRPPPAGKLAALAEELPALDEALAAALADRPGNCTAS